MAISTFETLPKEGWHPILDKAHKGFDGDKSGIARPGTVVPLRLQVMQEIHDTRSIKLLERERGRRDPQPHAGELA